MSQGILIQLVGNRFPSSLEKLTESAENEVIDDCIPRGRISLRHEKSYEGRIWLDDVPPLLSRETSRPASRHYELRSSPIITVTE